MIRWDNATLSFGDRQLFVSKKMHIKPKEKILLQERSGSGKTSLLKTALGLIKLDSGHVYINGSEVTASNIDSIRSDIFYLDQDVTLPELEVSELISEIFNFKGNKNRTYKERELLSRLELFHLDPEILQNNIKDLSGGERQRVGIIIGLLLKKPIWLLDEPTSSLDKELKTVVMDTILEQDITAIIISHDSCWSILCQ